jgi:hypothetical protein
LREAGARRRLPRGAREVDHSYVVEP